jgi:tetratricopeptide (TPR) repeat protein
MALSLLDALVAAKNHAENGETDEAARLYRMILAKMPNDKLAQAGLAALGVDAAVIPEMSLEQEIEAVVALFNSGQLAPTIEKCQALISAHPDAVALHNILGAANAGVGQIDRAISAFERAVEIMPNYAIGRNNLGNALASRGDLDAAEAQYDAAIKLEPNYVDAHFNLAKTLDRQGRHEDAIASYRGAIALAPDHAKAHNNLANLLNAAGNNGAALESFRHALQVNKNYAECYLNYAYSTKITADDPLIPRLRQLVDQTLSDTDRVHASFALGKSELDLGNSAAGVELLSSGGALRKAQLSYTIDRDIDLFDRIKAIFSGAITAATTAFEPSPTSPIFILGMPRSGTTLVEQIVSAHDDVFGGGELAYLEHAAFQNGAPRGVDEPRQLAAIRDHYLGAISKLTALPFCTDKTTLNFRAIGYILTALPEAKVIHVKRDAMAVCWSIFRTYFPAPGMAFSLNQRDIAAYHRLYEELMAFWALTFPGRIHHLSYEELTENQEPESRRLMDFIGLNWQDQLLDFHTNRRVVQTASANQVRQEIYTGSSKDWQQYEPWLSEMMAELARA